MNRIDELRVQLRAARERLRRASAALAPKHQGGEWDRFLAADQEVLNLERRLAAAVGDEYAEPFDFPLKWDSGRPRPHVLATDNRALLVFSLRGTPARSVDSRGAFPANRIDPSEFWGLVEFDGCVSVKLGTPNDEVHSGHPLSGKGLEPYCAQRVVNSHWLKELEAIHSVHAMYRPETWRNQSHFIFWFHDSTFECIAHSYRVETYPMELSAMLRQLAERLVPTKD